MNTIKLNTIGTPIGGGGNSGNGGGKELTRNDVNFFDYDGTLLYSYTYEEACALTELPALPTHEGLEVREWNYTLEDIKEQGTGGIIVDNDFWTALSTITIDGVEYKTYGTAKYDKWYAIHKSSDAVEVGTICYWYYDDGEEAYFSVDEDGNPYELPIQELISTNFGKADVGACVYDEDGKQVAAADVLIFERGTESINYYCGDYWNVDTMFFKLISIPNTVNDIYISKIVIERLVIPIGVALLETYDTIYGNILKEFWQNGYALPLYTMCMNLPQVYEIPSNFSSLGDSYSSLATYNSVYYLPKTITYISSLNGIRNIETNTFIVCKEHTSIPLLGEALDGCTFNIIVPDELYESWCNASNWSSEPYRIHKISDYPYFNNK